MYVPSLFSIPFVLSNIWPGQATIMKKKWSSVGDTLLASECDNLKCILFQQDFRLQENNHRSFFFYLNILVFQNMTSFGNKTLFCAKPHSFGCSGCIFYAIYTYFTFSLPYSLNELLIDFQQPFSMSTTTPSNVITFLLNLQSNNPIKKG